MDTITKTTTKVITNTKLAIATAFLGVAALAAAFLGGVSPKRADLIVENVVFNDILIENDPKYEGYDTIVISYRNIGKTPINKPFNLLVRFNPAPSGQVKAYLNVNNGGIASNGLVFATDGVIKSSVSGVYVVPIWRETVNNDFSLAGVLNKYNLQPNGEGFARLFIPKYFKENYSNSDLLIYAMVDSSKVIPEFNENNNTKSLTVQPLTLTSSTLFISWASDTPSGTSTIGVEQSVAKIVIKNLGSSTANLTLKNLPFLLVLNTPTTTAITGIKKVKIYRNSVFSDNIIYAKSIQPSDWTKSAPETFAILIGQNDPDMADVAIQGGSQEVFFVIMDTSNDIKKNASLCIKFESGQVQWVDSFIGAVQTGISGSTEINSPKCLYY